MSWHKRSRHEALLAELKAIRAQRREFLWVGAAVLVLGTPAFAFFLRYLTVAGNLSRPSWLVALVVAASIITVALAWTWFRDPWSEPYDRVICTSCFSRMDPDGASARCSCGGHLEPLSRWYWVEDDTA